MVCGNKTVIQNNFVENKAAGCRCGWLFVFDRLPVRPAWCYLAAMSASQVIEEIKHLPRAEQSRVLRFAFELARERQLPGKELSSLAQKMADSGDSAKAKKLRDEIHRGFYGE
jgi:hypothetical protein